MRFNFKKGNVLDTILSIALAVCLFLTFVALFLPLVSQFNINANASTYEAIIAFEAMVVVFGGLLAEIVQLEMLEIFPKNKAWSVGTRIARWVLAGLIVLFAIIAIACAGACGTVDAGPAICFVFGFLAAGCGACVGIRDLVSKKKEEPKVENKEEE